MEGFRLARGSRQGGGVEMGVIGYVFGYHPCLWIAKKEERSVNLSFYANVWRFSLLLGFTKKVY
jgi:hypothetical protein